MKRRPPTKRRAGVLPPGTYRKLLAIKGREQSPGTVKQLRLPLDEKEKGLDGVADSVIIRTP
jgi:hypothetical protein